MALRPSPLVPFGESGGLFAAAAASSACAGLAFSVRREGRRALAALPDARGALESVPSGKALSARRRA